MKKSLLTGIGTLLALTLLSSAPAWGAERTFKLATNDPIDAPGPKAAVKLGELLDQKSGGTLKVKVYASAVLGSDVQIHGALPGGSVEMAMVGAPVVGSLIKEFGVLDFPYMYASPAEAHAMLDSPMGKQLLGKLTDKNIIGLSFWEIGFRAVTNSRHPVARWEDMQGLKIRTVQSPVFRAFFNALGANALPMPVGEVFSALETRAIDAQENPPSIIAAMRFDEVQKYLSRTDHIYTSYALLISKKIWDGLSDQEKQWMNEAVAEATVYQRTLSGEDNEAKVAELQKRGMQVNTLTEAERARFAEKAQPVIAEAAKAIDAAFVSAWMDELKKVKAAQ